jgi:putative Mg2+ transporter-C (MgtC) family protein
MDYAQLMQLLHYTGSVWAALVLGIILGLERQYGQHPAGLRTNALVCVGAAMFVSVSGLLGHLADTSRIAAYVVSGIGFLGGGVILREGLNVRGLNTAATLWCSAAVGTLCGAGLVPHATVGTLVVLAIHLGLRPLAQWIDAHRKTATDIETSYRLKVVVLEKEQALIRSILLRHINGNPKMIIQSLATQDCDQPDRMMLVVDVYSIQRNERALEEIVQRLHIEPGVVSVGWEKRS